MKLFGPAGVIILAALVFVSGCSRFQESEVYQRHLSPEHNVRLFNEQVAISPRPISPDHNILVVARAADPGLKQKFEDALVARLQAEGYRALPAYQAYPSYGDAYFSADMFRVRAGRLNISHVFVTDALETRREELYANRSNNPLTTAEPIPSTSSMRTSGPEPPISDWPSEVAGKPVILPDIAVIDQGRGRKVGTVDRDRSTEVVLMEAQLLEVAANDPVWSASVEAYLLRNTDYLLETLVDRYVDRLAAASLLN